TFSVQAARDHARMVSHAFYAGPGLAPQAIFYTTDKQNWYWMAQFSFGIYDMTMRTFDIARKTRTALSADRGVLTRVLSRALPLLVGAFLIALPTPAQAQEGVEYGPLRFGGVHEFGSIHDGLYA